MKITLVIITLLFSLSVFAIDAPKLSSINVHELDSTLDSQAIDKWLISVLPKGYVIETTSQLTGCGEISGDPGQQGYPLCMEVTLKNNDEKQHLYIVVGTSKNGVSGKPEFYWGMVKGKAIYKLSKLVTANAL
jgi:hypothetical protein